MRIYLDLDTRKLMSSPIRALSKLEFKRRDNDTIELQFLRDGTVQELAADTSARLGIKIDADYDSDFLALTTLNKSGSGINTVYGGNLNLNTDAIATAFLAEPVTFAAMLEVEWKTGAAVSSSLTLPVTLINDVIRGDEGEPVDLPLFYLSETSDLLATQAQAEAGADNTAWMSPLRTAQAIAALAESGGVSSWNDLTDKPATFPPATHTHTIGQVTDLQNELDGKAATTHTHTIAQVTGLQAELDALAEGGGGVSSWNDLTDKPTEFLPSTHTHTIGQVTDLQNELDGKAATTHTHGNITNAGAIGTTSGVPIVTGADGVLQAGAFGTTAGTYAAGNHTHTGMVIASGGITNIAVVSSMPATPDPATLYIVTA